MLSQYRTSINENYPGVVQRASKILYRRYSKLYARQVMDIEDVISENYINYLEQREEQGDIPENWLFVKMVDISKDNFEKMRRDFMFYKNERLLYEAYAENKDIFDIVKVSKEAEQESFDEEAYQKANELCEICIGRGLEPETVKGFVAYVEEHCDDYPEDIRYELEDTLFNLHRSGVKYRIHGGKLAPGTKDQSLLSVVRKLILEEGMNNKEIKKYLDDNDFIYVHPTLLSIISKVRNHHNLARTQTPDDHLSEKIKEYLAKGYSTADTQRFIEAYMARTGIEFKKRYKTSLRNRISWMKMSVTHSQATLLVSVPEETHKKLSANVICHKTIMSKAFESALRLRKGTEIPEQLRTLEEALKRSYQVIEERA